MMKKLVVLILKKTGIVLFYTLLLLNLFILFSGKTYLYEGIFQTYLHGRSSPGIYDLPNFHKRKISQSASPIPWAINTGNDAISLSKSEEEYHQQFDSKAFIILQNDTIIYEKYWDEHSIGKVSNSFSMSKSIVSLLIGIALEEKKIKNLDEPVWHYLPSFKEYGRKSITLRHLLSMSSGFEWDESGSNPLSENAEAYYTDDLYGLMMRQRVAEDPGKAFIYQSGNTQVLGHVLEKATGVSLSNYAAIKLWGPLGAENPAYWSLDKENGNEKSFCCYYATARDFARIGSLLVNKGVFSGKRIVSEAYMDEVVKWGDLITKEGIKNQRYGLHFWAYKNGSEWVYYCIGFKGQFIITIPSRKIVIVRIGNVRDRDVSATDVSLSNIGMTKQNLVSQIGHPRDLFVYLKMVNRMLNQKSQKR
jgi:CubicO group peptidase (beta-lactamase class C family)